MNEMQAQANENYAIGWDDEITGDGQEFILLPEGDYDFEVVGFERGRFPGGKKLAPCNQAVLKLKVATPDGDAMISDNLLMCRPMQWKISAFLIAIGQKKKGEDVRPDWNAMVGATGRAKIGIRHWENAEKGTSGDSNQVEKYYPKEEKAFTAGTF